MEQPGGHEKTVDQRTARIAKAKSALPSAIKEGRVDMILRAIKLGVDLNETINATVGVSTQLQRYDPVKDLMQLMAIPGEAGLAADGYPLLLACATGRLDVVSLLVTAGGVSLDVVPDSGRTALHWAARSGNKRLVEYLVDLKVNTLAKDKHGVTALHMAAAIGILDVVKYLAEHGLSARNRDEAGVTALHLAAYSGNRNLVDWLLRHGLDLRAQDEMGRTALHLAAVAGSKPMVAYLERKGLSIHARDRDGRTPIYLGVCSGNRELVEYLLDRGVDVLAKDRWGKSAFSLVSGTL